MGVLHGPNSVGIGCLASTAWQMGLCMRSHDKDEVQKLISCVLACDVLCAALMPDDYQAVLFLVHVQRSW
jgi:hypothetical protein